MEKKLPSVYANAFQKKMTNVQEIFYGQNEVVEERSLQKDSTPIDVKINRIFNSPNHVYQSLVEIRTADKTLQKSIIGKTDAHLLTKSNEKIPIMDILDIRKI